MKHLAEKEDACYNHGEKEVLETIPEGCTCSMFRNKNPFRQAVYNRLFY